MKNFQKIFLLSISLILFACQPKEIKDVSYSKDVQPILDKHCTQCHNAKKHLGNLNFESYEALMSSRYYNRNEPVALPSDPEESRLYFVVKSDNPAIRMPPANYGYSKLDILDIQTIETWIKEGAKNN